MVSVCCGQVSPADVVRIVQHFDPLCNREALPQQPATVTDATAMLDRQRLARAAVMRGVGLSNTAELVDAIHALQKSVVEGTAETHALDDKLVSVESTLRAEMTEGLQQAMDAAAAATTAAATVTKEPSEGTLERVAEAQVSRMRERSLWRGHTQPPLRTCGYTTRSPVPN
jgi:hypothetical protein